MRFMNDTTRIFRGTSFEVISENTMYGTPYLADLNSDGVLELIMKENTGKIVIYSKNSEDVYRKSNEIVSNQYGHLGLSNVDISDINFGDMNGGSTDIILVSNV